MRRFSNFLLIFLFFGDTIALLSLLWLYFVSTGVADLEAAPEVAQTKSIKYELEPASAQAFPSIHTLKDEGLHDAIATTYSDGGHLCRSF